MTALKDIETVICTFTVFTDDAVTAQTNLISAAVEAGCTRFCPSEFGGKLNTRPSYYRKAQIIDVLEHTPQLEYTAFSPGFFMDYFAVPHAITHLAQFVAYVDAEAGEAIVCGTGDEPIVLTSARDTARFIARIRRHNARELLALIASPSARRCRFAPSLARADILFARPRRNIRVELS